MVYKVYAPKQILLILFILTSPTLCQLFTIDTSYKKTDNQTNKKVQVFNGECQRNIEIDLQFHVATFMKCNSTSCRVDAGRLSNIHMFHNSWDDPLNMELKIAEYVKHSFIKNRYQNGIQEASFVLKFSDGTHTAFVIVPTLMNSANNTQEQLRNLEDQNIIDVMKLDVEKEYQNFVIIKEFTDVYEFPMSGFSFLNMRDFGGFYSVMNSQENIIVLISINVYKMPDDFIGPPIEPTNSALPTWLNLDYKKTAKRSCYGSVIQQNIFQTHLRDNYPLWTCWFCLLIFWGYYLIVGRKNKKDCFNPYFKDNKWTCWSIYSLYYLGNNEFFSRLSRMTILFLDFSLQAFFLGVIYSSVGKDFALKTMAWSSAVAFVITFPLSFIFGKIFHKSFGKQTMQKFQATYNLNQAIEAEDRQQIQHLKLKYLDVEEQLYGTYFIYYTIAIFTITTLWAACIYLMQQTYKYDYQLHPYWLASLGINIVLNTLIFDPILTYFFGDKNFYQARGFYYDFDLGQAFKEVQKN